MTLTIPNPSNVKISFDTRADFISASVPSMINYVMAGGLVYERDTSGTALTQSDGTKWSPTLDKITPLHFGAVGDGVTDDTTAINNLLTYVGSINADVVFNEDARNTFGARIVIKGDSGKVFAIQSELSLTGSHKNVRFEEFHLIATGGSWATTDFLVSCGGLATYVEFHNCQFNCANLVGGVKLSSRNRWVGGWIEKVAGVGIECSGSDVWIDRAIIGQWTTNDVEYYDKDAYSGIGIHITESDARVTSCTIRWLDELIRIESTNNIIQHCHMFNGMQNYVASDRTSNVNVSVRDALDVYFGRDTSAENFARRTAHVGVSYYPTTPSDGKSAVSTFDGVYFDNCHHELYCDTLIFNKCKFGSKFSSSLNTEDTNNSPNTNPAYNDTPTIDYWFRLHAYEAVASTQFRIAEPESYVTSGIRHWVKYVPSGANNWAADTADISASDTYNLAKADSGKQLGDGFKVSEKEVHVGDPFQGPLVTWYGMRDNVRVALANNDQVSGPVEIRALGDDFQVRPQGTTKFEVNTDGPRMVSPTVPTTASDTGVAGQYAYDNNYLYICVSTDTWKRVAISTW